MTTPRSGSIILIRQRGRFAFGMRSEGELDGRQLCGSSGWFARKAAGRWPARLGIATWILSTSKSIELGSSDYDWPRRSSGRLWELATTEGYSIVCQEGTRKVERLLSCQNLKGSVSFRYQVNSGGNTRLPRWASRVSANKSRIINRDKLLQLLSRCMRR